MEPYTVGTVTLPTGPGSTIDVAVLMATASAAEGGAAALLPCEGQTALSRLAEQLRSTGVRRTVVVTRPAWAGPVQEAAAGLEVRFSECVADDLRVVSALAREVSGHVLLLYGDLVTHREALTGVIAHPGDRSAVLTGGRRRPVAFRAQTRRGRMISAGSAYHAVRRPNATFLGVLRVGPADLPILAAAGEQLGSLMQDVPEAWKEELEGKTQRWRLALGRRLERDGATSEGDDAASLDENAEPNEAAGADDDAPDDAREGGPAPSADDEAWLAARTAAGRDDCLALLLVALIRRDVHVKTVYLRRFLWARPLATDTADQVSERLAATDEDRLRLESSVKSADGFFTTFFVTPYSKHLARWAARRGLTPNQVTTASLFIAVLAATAFATGTRSGLVTGAILLQVAFTTDCVDGQLARYTRTFSTFGAWLDAVFDRAKEYVAFAGLGIGASRAGDAVWLLACSAITLQTVRHMSDFAYATVRRYELTHIPQPPVEEVRDFAGAAAATRRAQADAALEAGSAPTVPSRSPAVRALAAWRTLDRSRAMRWIKRMLPFPIGERFAVISVTAALFTPRVTFIALLVCGSVGFVYVHVGRILRSMR